MKSSNKEVTINHNAKQLFNIVLDLEKYPEFIPWCTDMKIYSKKPNEIFADMYVFYKLLLPQKFGSHVIFNVEKLEIKTIYIDGPLKDLKTDWQFNPISRNETIVNFTVHFEFKRFLHQKFAEIFYPLIENNMIESFKQRASQILN